jgi:hypothetical protein
MSYEITLHAVEVGRRARKRIKQDSTYNDWMAVGAGPAAAHHRGKPRSLSRTQILRESR